eukprot:scaffold1365_cov163-Ochromonas_danica.AAC.24
MDLLQAIRRYPVSLEKQKIRCVGREVNAIGSLPTVFTQSIKTLLLSNNALTSLAGVEQFSHLETLSVANNLIDYLEDICALSSLPWLRKLSLYGNAVSFLPFYAEMVISQCPRLEVLDGSEVDDFRRSESVLAFKQVIICYRRAVQNEVRNALLHHLLLRLRCNQEVKHVVLWRGRSRGAPSTSVDASCPLQHVLRTISSHGGFSAFIEADGGFFSKMVQHRMIKAAAKVKQTAVKQTEILDGVELCGQSRFRSKQVKSAWEEAFPFVLSAQEEEWVSLCRLFVGVLAGQMKSSLSPSCSMEGGILAESTQEVRTELEHLAQFCTLKVSFLAQSNRIPLSELSLRASGGEKPTPRRIENPTVVFTPVDGHFSRTSAKSLPRSGRVHFKTSNPSERKQPTEGSNNPSVVFSSRLLPRQQKEPGGIGLVETGMKQIERHVPVDFRKSDGSPILRDPSNENLTQSQVASPFDAELCDVLLNNGDEDFEGITVALSQCLLGTEQSQERNLVPSILHEKDESLAFDQIVQCNNMAAMRSFIQKQAHRLLLLQHAEMRVFEGSGKRPVQPLLEQAHDLVVKATTALYKELCENSKKVISFRQLNCSLERESSLALEAVQQDLTNMQHQLKIYQFEVHRLTAIAMETEGRLDEESKMGEGLQKHINAVKEQMQRVQADLSSSAYYVLDLYQRRRHSRNQAKNNDTEVKCLLRKVFRAFARSAREQRMLRVLFTQPMFSLYISPSCPSALATLLQKRLRSRMGTTFSIWRRFVVLHNYIGKTEIAATRVLLKRMLRRFSTWINRRKMELHAMQKCDYGVENRIDAGLRQSRMEFSPRASLPQRIPLLAQKWKLFKERIRYRKMARARTQYLQLCGRVFLSISTIRKWRLATILERRYQYLRSNEIRGLYIQRWFHRMVTVAQQLVNRREQVQFSQSRLLFLRSSWNSFRKGLLKHGSRRNKMNCWHIMVAMSEIKQKCSWALKKWVDFAKKSRRIKHHPGILLPNTHLLYGDHRNGEVLQREVDESFNACWLKLSTTHISRSITSIKTSGSDVVFRERISGLVVKDGIPNEIVWTPRLSKITTIKYFSVWQHRIVDVLRSKIMVTKNTSSLLSEPSKISNNLRDRIYALRQCKQDLSGQLNIGEVVLADLKDRGKGCDATIASLSFSMSVLRSSKQSLTKEVNTMLQLIMDCKSRIDQLIASKKQLDGQVQSFEQLICAANGQLPPVSDGGSVFESTSMTLSCVDHNLCGLSTSIEQQKLILERRMSTLRDLHSQYILLHASRTEFSKNISDYHTTLALNCAQVSEEMQNAEEQCNILLERVNGFNLIIQQCKTQEDALRQSLKIAGMP